MLAACVGDNPATSGSSADVVSGGGDGAAAKLDIHVVRDPSATGHPAAGARVRVEGLVVTAVKTAGATHAFSAQDPASPAWGAIYVYLGDASPTVQENDVIAVEGTFKTYRGLDEIDATAGKVETTGKADDPDPIQVSVADIREGGPRAAELQSVLVEVKNVVATRATSYVDFGVAAAGSKDSELIVTSFVAGDTGPSPFPATAGQTYSAIRGVGFRFGASDTTTTAKLAPRYPSDLVSP